MTESQIKELGFANIETYSHDGFKTNRYLKGVLEVEFTYEGKKLVTVDVTIDKTFCLPISQAEIIELDKILNKTR